MILPTNTIERLSERATQILGAVQRFFAFHLIENFGCDYSSSGIASDAVEAKLKTFFQKCTKDGPRFDSYLLYYSGAVGTDGNWALAGKNLIITRLGLSLSPSH